ncbi:hypothetical protein MACK_003881 [Theileria orientalis]|uniref:Uncharacterized protein n=1 Tax=Theileria orientalis TaxID=68886 RepID=A0A976XIL5_THEOR|nr:hypothetical protein MACK_003881 [Theileria orientalis]
MKNKIGSPVAIVLPLLLSTLARLVILGTLVSIIKSSAKVMANTKKGLAKRKGCKVEDTEVFNSYRLSQLIDDIMDILIVENKKNIDNTRLEVSNSKALETEMDTNAKSNGNPERKGRKKMKSGSRRGYGNTNVKGYKNFSNSNINKCNNDENNNNDDKDTNCVEENIVSIEIENSYDNTSYNNNDDGNIGNDSIFNCDNNENDNDNNCSNNDNDNCSNNDNDNCSNKDNDNYNNNCSNNDYDNCSNNHNYNGNGDENEDTIISGSDYDSDSYSGTYTDDTEETTIMAITDTPTTISTAVTSTTNTSISTTNTAISTTPSICNSDYSGNTNNNPWTNKSRSSVKGATTAIVEITSDTAIRKYSRRNGKNEEDDDEEDGNKSISVSGNKKFKQLISDMIHIIRGDENFRVKEIKDNLKFINYFNKRIPDEIRLNNQKLEQCRHKLAVNDRNIIHGRPSMTNHQLNKVKEKMQMLKEENEALKKGSERLKRIEDDLRERMKRIKAYLRVFEGSQGYILGIQ